MKPFSQNYFDLTGVVLLGLTSAVVAHGHDEDMIMDIGGATTPRPTLPSLKSTPNATVLAIPETYFRYNANSALLTAHILLMVISWVFILPIGVMFSISRSRYTLPVQFSFLVLNSVGVLLVIIYNTSTPDLYPNNAHHKLGWIVTWVMGVQAFIGLINAYAGRNKGMGRIAYHAITSEAMKEHQQIHNLRQAETYRFSNDSGQGTEPNTESLRSHSISSNNSDHLPEVLSHHGEEQGEKLGLMHGSKVDKYLAEKIPRIVSSKFLRVFQLFYSMVDRLILLLGFVTLTSGIVTYGGFFMGRGVFSGLAHFIKGGVFFWYGVLTLGRWAGCFADIGWSWNINPSKKAHQPSAEFMESFLIFFYGATNIFLEHLGGWGGAWSATDLEHISITVMFIGGGLCGMLIESKRIRNLLNESKLVNANVSYDMNIMRTLEEPKSYSFSMNPIPALIVLLLGLMMSSHHQESMVSTMIHKQWGNLLVGAAFARAASYIICYLSPPTSFLPGRPPTELITAFGLMAGGMVFMSSAHDTVAAMEANNLDAMFIFTVSMGMITFLMAWVILVIAVKGWAVRRELRATGAFGFHPVAA